MEEKVITEENIEKVAGGLSDNDEEVDEDVWTWHKCYWPSCHIEDRVWGRISKGTMRMCPYCHHDTFESQGRYEK